MEDDESILFNLKLSLEMNEFEVLTASNGVKALSLLKNCIKIPNLILSEIMMPEMDGYEFLEEIRKDNKLKNIPFIFVSAKSSSDDIRVGKNLGICDYVTKPIKEEILLNVIKKNLEKINA